MTETPQLLLEHSGPILFGVVLLEQAGLPLPAMPWLLAAGALAANGRANPIMSIGVAVLACMVADSGWFYVGRRKGKGVLGCCAGCHWSRVAVSSAAKIFSLATPLKAWWRPNFCHGSGW